MKPSSALHDDALLRLFLEQLRNRLGRHLKDVILFGSRARGDERQDSDYDCLAVVDRITPSLLDSIDDITGNFLYAYSVVFSVVPITEERHQQRRKNPFLMNIQREGVRL